MSIRWISGILGDGAGVGAGDIVTLVEERFDSDFGTLSTPGSDEPEEAWSLISVATPSGTTGPGGGSNPATRAVQVGNQYAYTEGTPAGGGVGPQRQFTMETPDLDAGEGLITLLFDLHMRYGSEGGITDGELFIEGWNGSAWSTISNTVQGSQQLTATTPYRPSTDFGTYDSTGFANADFKFRWRLVTGPTSNNFDTAVDNVIITGPETIVIAPPAPPPDVGATRASFFNTGLRRLHVSKGGAAPIDGTSPNQSFSTIQAAVNAAQAGDVITVGAGRYFETIQRSNLQGSVNSPVWIASEVPFEAQISNLKQNALDGSAPWRNDGGGVFSTPGNPAYAAWFGEDVFLPQWLLADLNDDNFAVESSASEAGTTLDKPDRGFAFSGGRIHVRLPDGSSPSGQNVNITDDFNATLMNFSNCDNVIVDGFIMEGAGDGSSITFSENSANPRVKNCVFVGAQFGVRVANDTVIEDCEYLLPGHSQFGTDLRALNPSNLNALFRYHKNYNNAGKFKPGSNNSSDALMEGGIDINRFGGTPPLNITVQRCWIHEVFEGSKFGRMRSGVLRECVFDECGDDAVEMEANESNPSVFGQKELHDCLIRNCFSSVSHQGNILSEQFVYRNVIEISDPEVAGFPAFLLKMINTQNNANIHYYHNTMINRVAAADNSPGFGTNHWVWFGFGASRADRIRNWISNIVIQPLDLDDAAVNPNNRQNNVVNSPSDNDQSGDVQGTGGIFSSEAAIDLQSDFSLGAGSTAIGAGLGSIPAGFPDSRTTGTPFADAGAFPEDFTVPANWPRAQSRVFDDNRPENWTSPGA